jgi:hypothetical protein
MLYLYLHEDPQPNNMKMETECNILYLIRNDWRNEINNYWYSDQSNMNNSEEK